MCSHNDYMAMIAYAWSQVKAMVEEVGEGNGGGPQTRSEVASALSK